MTTKTGPVVSFSPAAPPAGSIFPNPNETLQVASQVSALFV